ncbi:hypothetical protein C8J57DRAFT_1522999 [Mycena rebaudengoi]|nr:hypothetical protein C8J57DRAFT_1522999 [Mycena rebaudengoi]
MPNSQPHHFALITCPHHPRNTQFASNLPKLPQIPSFYPLQALASPNPDFAPDLPTGRGAFKVSIGLIFLSPILVPRAERHFRFFRFSTSHNSPSPNSLLVARDAPRHPPKYLSTRQLRIAHNPLFVHMPALRRICSDMKLSSPTPPRFCATTDSSLHLGPFQIQHQAMEFPRSTLCIFPTISLPDPYFLDLALLHFLDTRPWLTKQTQTSQPPSCLPPPSSLCSIPRWWFNDSSPVYTCCPSQFLDTADSPDSKASTRGLEPKLSPSRNQRPTLSRLYYKIPLAFLPAQGIPSISCLTPLAHPLSSMPPT